MKKATPKWDVMQEYILHNGIDWVMKEYNLTLPKIQDILYGGTMTTPERDKKLKKKVIQIY